MTRLLLTVICSASLVLLSLKATSTNAFVATLHSTSLLSRHNNHHWMAKGRPEWDVSFGSEETSGLEWGLDEGRTSEDEDDHAEKVAALMAAADQAFYQERRARRLGRFANVTRAADLKAVIQEERAALQQANDRKAALAAQAGVEWQVLAPKEEKLADASSSSSSSANVHITRNSDRSWFADMDEDIQAEWNELTQGDAKEPDSDDSINDGNNTDTDDNAAFFDVTVDDATGRMISRDALAGVRVGSAGGWTLEVFPGDFVVHRKFGIGRFVQTTLRPKTKLTPEEKEARDARRAEILTRELRARKKVTPDEIQAIRSTFGTEEDNDPISNPQTTVLEIAYADAIVHVPVDRAYRLSRFRAGDAPVKPRLSRVRGDAWARARRKVEESTFELAQDVLALYATRETLQRVPFDPMCEEKVRELEATFPFEPTPDQIKCFEDVENDMVWRNRPMDRLVCGDVGFGKTEVAMRALYRSVANGRQAALLAPTGVLAAQHYKNILKRMGPDTPFNVTVALLRGGTKTSKAGRELREQMATGNVQLVVGTHAILSKGVEFKDLGLLVVDEEQRFGVKQKERLKLISSGIDVLTLSATPIPRTLQMSLSGIRDTSTIRSPPPMRKPTITYVQDFSEEMVKDAISRELGRNGQCYYVVPRIALIQEAQEMIERLFPDIRIIVAHGRMHRNGAEDNVAAFAEGNYDVLLATTVIENGVDIPSTNTIIVQDSQIFGMSTLYQLRGRVGRSDKQAYAYFLHREESVTEQSVLRLQAIGELNELGSGFDVANRDLEIRGAGSLLGTEQSGMASRVGFDLYMRMLKKTIRQLRGLDLPLVPRTNMLIPTNGTPSTFTLPKTLIPDDEIRLREESQARLAESTAKLVNLTNTWKKEYGNLPLRLQNQLKTLHLHACTRRLGIDLVGMVDAADGSTDCILRSPGLRPRHWGIILGNLPQKAAPKGLDVYFPSRFTLSGGVEEYLSGTKVDLQQLLEDDILGEDQEDKTWDALDEEEVEAMKDITSAMNVKDMTEIDIDQYPRFAVHNFSPKNGVDQLLKVLLPIAKVVYQRQEDQAEQAKAAAKLRERQELLQKGKTEAQRAGYHTGGLSQISRA